MHSMESTASAHEDRAKSKFVFSNPTEGLSILKSEYLLPVENQLARKEALRVWSTRCEMQDTTNDDVNKS